MSVAEEIKRLAERSRAKCADIGVFAVGHSEYWPQFPALKEALMAHYRFFCDRLAERIASSPSCCAVMSDNYATGLEVADYFLHRPIDLAVCFVATYSPAVCAFTVLSKLSCPFILVCMQPSDKLDYPNATTEMQLENDNITSLPEIVSALGKVGRRPLDCVVGALYGDERSWDKLTRWCQVARVKHHLAHAHIGYMGQLYEGMLDMSADVALFDARFGMHVEQVEIDELSELVKGVTKQELDDKLYEITSLFDMPDPGADPIASKVVPSDLDWPARVSVGMDKLMLRHNLDGLAYYYKGLPGSLNARLHAGMIIGNSLLTGMGLPIAGELDLKNCVAMLILDRLGAGGSFAELHPIDFDGDFVLVGHDGPHHVAIAQGKPALRNLRVMHGKRGCGPSVEFTLKLGPISMLGLTQNEAGGFKFVFAHGESCAGPIPATGNTNTRGRFLPDVRTFLERWSMEGPTHHFALGIGDLTRELMMLSRMLNIEMVKVTP